MIGVWKDGNSRGGSVALHDAVNVGDRLEISLPRNRFRVPKNATRAILLARGIGVTPILSIADDLKTRGVPFELHYVYALMSPNAFSGFIGELSFAENTTYYLETSKDNQLLNPATLFADRPDDTQLFICGADWWMDPIVSLAKQKGWSEERIHVERFTAKLAAPVLDKVFDVKIASTGAVYKISWRQDRHGLSRGEWPEEFRHPASRACAAPARSRCSKARSIIATSASRPSKKQKDISWLASLAERAICSSWICEDARSHGSFVMTLQEQVWNTAWILAEHYGEEGISVAADMAKSFETGGKHEERDVWLSIMEKVRELTVEHDGVSAFRQ